MARAAYGFFFNVEHWFGSASVSRMSFAEKGVYLAMLFEQVRDPTHTLPDDPQAVADLIACTDAQVADVVAAWPVVRRKFVVDGRRPGRVLNLRLSHTLREQTKHLRARSNAGMLAGKASAAKRRTLRELGGNERSTFVNDFQQISKENSKEKREHVRTRARATFDRFWTVYPKRTAQQEVERWFEHVHPDGEFAEKIIASATHYAAHVKDWEPRFVKGPLRWLEGAHWEDEHPTPPGERRQDSDVGRSIYEVCQHEPKCSGWGQHDVKTRIETGRPKPVKAHIA